MNAEQQVKWLREMAGKCTAPFYIPAITRPEGLETGIPVKCALCGHLGSVWVDPGKYIAERMNEMVAEAYAWGRRQVHFYTCPLSPGECEECATAFAERERP